MNATVRNLMFITLAMMTFNQAMAQKANFTTNNGMMIGFGFGGSYQQSDILNSRGAGFDFTLGHPIYKKENAFISIDWKFRFLAGANRAFDNRLMPDNTFRNIRLDVYNFDLEFGFTLNRLRERTRIVITGFAGAGMTVGSTATDLYDANGLLYDYSVINTNQEKSKIYSDLVKLSDGNFETHLFNKTAILPTLGFFLGYQFTPSFVLGIEHKTNFSLTEKNSFVGINIDNNIMKGSNLDRMHYTSISLRWNLRGRSAGSAGNYTYPSGNYVAPENKVIEQTEPVLPPPPPPVRTTPPIVDITNPSGITYSTTEESINISARVENVSSKQDLQLVLNGNGIGFDYDPGTGIVRSKLVLAEGKNDLVITGVNQGGSARDNVTITFNKPVRMLPPVIKFINPPEPVTVDRNIFELNVQTINIKAWQDVTVTINGRNTNNFNFSNQGVVITNVALKEGANTIEVLGKNESGTAKEVTTITYIKPVTEVKPVIEPVPCSQPELKMIIPAQDGLSTDNQSYTFIAEVKNITRREQLLLTLNSKNITNFEFDQSGISFTASLNTGNNSLVLTATNNCGTKTLSSSIIFKPVVPVTPVEKPCPPPVLRMTAPAQNDLTIDSSPYTFRTEVNNVSSKDQLLLTLNSKNIIDFNFSGRELIYSSSLNTGSNSFVLTATNNCGTATVTSSINYKPAVPVTVVEKPCPVPGLNFSVVAINQNDVTHELKGNVSNVKNRSGITITINGTPFEGFQFVPNAGVLSARFKFNPGTHLINITVKNECGQDSGSDTVIIQQPKPCPPPTLKMIAPAQNDLTTESPSYIFRTEVINITGKDQLLVTFNSKTITSFDFARNELTCAVTLISGANLFVVTAKSNCGAATVTSSMIYIPAEPIKDTVTIKEESPCGVRINPGNSVWEFCLVTPSGTFNRERLTNRNFSYSGPATSLFFMAVAGGGDAVVNGKPYSLRPGQYYLFEGNMTVTISTRNPGSMGQWSVCIITNKEPVSGNGSNRPKSPCEEIKDESTPKKDEPSLDNKNPGDVKPDQELKKDTTKTVGPKTGGKK